MYCLEQDFFCTRTLLSCIAHTCCWKWLSYRSKNTPPPPPPSPLHTSVTRTVVSCFTTFSSCLPVILTAVFVFSVSCGARTSALWLLHSVKGGYCSAHFSDTCGLSARHARKRNHHCINTSIHVIRFNAATGEGGWDLRRWGCNLRRLEIDLRR